MHAAGKNIGRGACAAEVIRSAGGPAAAYLATEIVTAGPRQLAKLLYGSVIRLCYSSIEALDDGDVDLAAERIIRARGIIVQLEKLARGKRPTAGWTDHYGRASAHLVEAGLYRSREAIAETIELLLAQQPQWDQLLAALGDAPGATGRTKSWVG